MIETPRALLDAHHMREFLHSPAHAILDRELDAAMADTISRMTGSDPETNLTHLAHYRGLYEGLKRARAIPERLIADGDRVRGGR